MVVQCNNLGHHIQLQETTIISSMEQMIGKATDTELHPLNMDREDGLLLSLP
jgi:hypothetical protein